jgi:hypothetical protein
MQHASAVAALAPDVLANHAALSPVDAQFREFASTDPECLSRETFKELVDDHALLHYERQPWPTFISPARHAEIREVSLALSRIIRTLPARLFANDPERIAAVYSLDKAAAKLLITPPDGIARALSRADFILGRDGLQCIEFNMTGSLGGWESGILAEIVLRIPPIARFLAQTGVQVTWMDTFRTTLLHTFREALEAGIADRANPEINLAITLQMDRPQDMGSGVDSFLSDAYTAALHAFDPAARGRLLICDNRELTDGPGGALMARGHRIHSLLEAHKLEARAVRAFKRGHVNLYNGPISWILSDKRNIALLSENAESPVFSEEEKAAIQRFIPWTRRVIPGETVYGGETVRLEGFLAASRERMILKRGRSAGGSHVFVGRFVTQEDWEAAIAEALRNAGDWVAQEHVESLPFLFQDGEHGCSPHDVIWGPFVAGDDYAGTILRVQPKRLGSTVNLTGGASEGVLLEVQEV